MDENYIGYAEEPIIKLLKTWEYDKYKEIIEAKGISMPGVKDFLILSKMKIEKDMVSIQLKCKSCQHTILNLKHINLLKPMTEQMGKTKNCEHSIWEPPENIDKDNYFAYEKHFFPVQLVLAFMSMGKVTFKKGETIKSAEEIIHLSGYIYEKLNSNNPAIKTEKEEITEVDD